LQESTASSLKIKQPIGVGVCEAVVVVGRVPTIEGARLVNWVET
jgi:hypothetical protein